MLCEDPKGRVPQCVPRLRVNSVVAPPRHVKVDVPLPGTWGRVGMAFAKGGMASAMAKAARARVTCAITNLALGIPTQGGSQTRGLAEEP